jgi:hypothetical protein
MDSGAAKDSASQSTILDANEHTPLHRMTTASPHLHALPAKPVLTVSDPAPSPLEGRVPSNEMANNASSERNNDLGQSTEATTLPPEILQHIFSFVDPISLARLLLVNKLFNNLVDPTKSLPVASSSAGSLHLRPQNDLWAVSRRAFFPGHPRPMEDMTEIAMWSLIRGVSCQFCGNTPKDKIPLVATSAWNAGPGPDGVRIIWPFRCRCCGPCLESRIVKVLCVRTVKRCRANIVRKLICCSPTTQSYFQDSRLPSLLHL